MDFALIPGGEFIMGDTLDGDTDAPTHKVNVSGFHRAKHEVTKTLWNEVRTWGLRHGYPSVLYSGQPAIPISGGEFRGEWLWTS